MKSRGTVLVLLAAVAVVWGVVAWKIFAPRPDAAAAPQRTAAAPQATDSDAGPLRLDYPDPFLKASGGPVRTVDPARTVKAPVSAPREQVRIVHLGTVAAAGRELHILTVDDRQFEVPSGGRAGAFRLDGGDPDSLYLTKDGNRYGVKRCEP